MRGGMTTVYISGGIANVPNHRERFTLAQMSLVRQGFLAVNPLNIGDCYTNREVIRGCAWPGEMMPTGHTWECYLRYDLREMLLCDKIAMLAGWRESRGASLEHEIALKVGIVPMYQRVEGEDFHDTE